MNHLKLISALSKLGSILLIVLCISCGRKSASIHENPSISIASYNIENLFDTIDDPVKADEYYTPDGPTNWTPERYYKKLSNLKRVYDAMGKPEILGIIEVENAKTLQNLADSLGGKSIVHYDSPDHRGIDVGLIYDPKLFDTLHSQIIRVPFPDSIEKDYSSRDILYVKMKEEKQIFHIYVNHWPSRRGGTAQSSIKREWVSLHLQEHICNVLAKEHNPLIIVMGDFNDEPENTSVQQLGNRVSECGITLVNMMDELKEKGVGSYNYRGAINMLDQFIVSEALGEKVRTTEVFQRPFMIYNDKRDGPKPNRTYGGPNYYGGYSDHFPILMEISLSR